MAQGHERGDPKPQGALASISGASAKRLNCPFRRTCPCRTAPSSLHSEETESASPTPRTTRLSTSKPPKLSLSSPSLKPLIPTLYLLRLPLPAQRHRLHPAQARIPDNDLRSRVSLRASSSLRVIQAARRSECLSTSWASLVAERSSGQATCGVSVRLNELLVRRGS